MALPAADKIRLTEHRSIPEPETGRVPRGRRWLTWGMVLGLLSAAGFLVSEQRHRIGLLFGSPILEFEALAPLHAYPDGAVISQSTERGRHRAQVSARSADAIKLDRLRRREVLSEYFADAPITDAIDGLEIVGAVDSELGVRETIVFGVLTMGEGRKAKTVGFVNFIAEADGSPAFATLFELPPPAPGLILADEYVLEVALLPERGLLDRVLRRPTHRITFGGPVSGTPGFPVGQNR